MNCFKVCSALFSDQIENICLSTSIEVFLWGRSLFSVRCELNFYAQWKWIWDFRGPAVTQSAVAYRECPGSTCGQSWDIWWENCHWDTIFSEYLRFPRPLSFCQFSILIFIKYYYYQTDKLMNCLNIPTKLCCFRYRGYREALERKVFSGCWSFQGDNSFRKSVGRLGLKSPCRHALVIFVWSNFCGRNVSVNAEYF